MSIIDVAAIVSRETGIVVGPQHRSRLERAVKQTFPGIGIGEIASQLADGPSLARLIDEFTVKETFFFREEAALAAIPWRTLLAQVHARGDAEVRVWSAACSTGEEPYTLAILACEAFRSVTPPVRIVATDVSQLALEQAREGAYRERSVRFVEPALRRRYFENDGVRHRIGAGARSLVEFRVHNLVRDPPVGSKPFDLILCRNVLIYFDSLTVGRVVASLEGALQPGGKLVLGTADTLCGITSRLERKSALALPSARAERPERAPRRPLGRSVASLEEPLPAIRFYTDGLASLEAGDPAAAAIALRRALYLDPDFALAAFQLGRAHEALGDVAAAKRLYAQALRTVAPDNARHDALLGHVDLADIALACRARLATLARTLGT